MKKQFHELGSGTARNGPIGNSMAVEICKGGTGAAACVNFREDVNITQSKGGSVTG